MKLKTKIKKDLWREYSFIKEQSMNTINFVITEKTTGEEYFLSESEIKDACIDFLEKLVLENRVLETKDF
jgi:hypothetical protein